jgi:hypothetical protein
MMDTPEAPSSPVPDTETAKTVTTEAVAVETATTDAVAAAKDATTDATVAAEGVTVEDLAEAAESAAAPAVAVATAAAAAATAVTDAVAPETTTRVSDAANAHTSVSSDGDLKTLDPLPGWEAIPVEKDGWVMVHDAIRLDMTDFIRTLVALKAHVEAGKAEAWMGVSIANWTVNNFYPFVHHHHDTEETIFFPAVAVRVSTSRLDVHACHACNSPCLLSTIQFNVEGGMYIASI